MTGPRARSSWLRSSRWPRRRAGGASRAARRPGPVTRGRPRRLLRWLADGHFTFLGYREYDLVDGPDDGMDLRAVPGSGLGILRHDRQASSAFAALPPEAREHAREPQLLILTKANSQSTVHRPSYLDYVAVKRLRTDGTVAGEYRFLGLYTHAAYSEIITRIPVLRRKMASVLETAGLTADSHDGKDLVEFLENYPREELFQTRWPSWRRSPTACSGCATASRPGCSCAGHLRAVHVLPGLHATGPLHHRGPAAGPGDPAAGAGRGLRRLQRDGRRVADRPAAVVVRGRRGQPLPEVDEAALERELAAAVRSWDDDLAEEAVRVLGPRRARALLAMCGHAIPECYKADVRRRGRGRRPEPACFELRESGRRSFASDRSGTDGTPGRRWLLAGCGCTGPARRSRSPTCCRSCSTWAWRSWTSTPTSSPGTASEPFWIYELRAAGPVAGRRGTRPRGDGGREQFEGRWPRCGTARSRTTASTRWSWTRA